MTDTSEWTEDDIRRLVLNPFYAITVHPMLCEPHEQDDVSDVRHGGLGR